MFSPKDKMARCSFRRYQVAQEIRMMCRKMKDAFRAVFKKSKRQGAKDDCAKMDAPLIPGATSNPEEIPLTRMLMCPRCASALRVGPNAANPFDPEPLNPFTPLSFTSACTCSGCSILYPPLHARPRERVYKERTPAHRMPRARI